ncbi:MAG TPA: mandelate racemase/muconate lactonizing enzyme family protein [Chloroflexi bacterium]|jgi:L-alanine-DL-glutamate epimerase-like enolase superfamily enzyme|nr:mandelate racemase/muconate lactonizing enzyme family protein [Chloroflexota bacterium]
MRIESVDMFYLSMPEIEDIGDGSQDACLVRLRAGDYVGWGECESSPLPTIAALVTPWSHSACKPVRDAVLGQRLDDVADIARIAAKVRADSLDLLQADHALSGIEAAMWDLLGKRLSEPVYRLLGYPCAYAKMPYASVLFGDTPQETLEKARQARAQGFRAAKFGWEVFGRGTVAEDADHLVAAREGLGPEGMLLIDAGTVWRDDLEAAAQRIPALQAARVTWLEEPFVSGALREYAALAARCAPVKLAAGEGSHNEYMAYHLIDYGGVGYIQIDVGRIGGIGAAKRVADYAQARGVTYVNHTFTSHLALSASLQPYAGVAQDVLSEYPMELKALAREMTVEHIERDAEGMIHAPDRPGLGMTPNTEALRKYLVDVEIRAKGEVRYRTPEL